MVRAYNQHGREAGRIVQLTSNREIEGEFLRRMRLARVRILPRDIYPFELLSENTASGVGREKLTSEHLLTIKAQWIQCAKAGKKGDTRAHFTALIPSIEARIVQNH